MKIGMIIMGHGHFASGMYSTLVLIGGEQEDVEWLDFTEEKDMDALFLDLKGKAETMKDCDYILVLCDLDGGTPYKAALLYSMENRKIEILSGINFPLTLECSLIRFDVQDVNDLLERILETGKTNMKRFDHTLMRT